MVALYTSLRAAGLVAGAILLLRLRRRWLDQRAQQQGENTDSLTLPLDGTELSQLRRAFEEDGVAIIRGAIPPEEVAVLREVLENVLSYGDVGGRIDASKEGASGRFLMELDACRWHFGLRDFACRSSVPALVAHLLGARSVRFFMDHVFLKEPGQRTHCMGSHETIRETGLR
jgi:hypothetical protein